MISRAHKILFIGMLVACVIMAAVLIRLRNRAQDRLQAEAAGVPAAISEQSGTPARAVTLYVPNDLDGSLTAVDRSIALPTDNNARARVLLESLIEAFHAPGSTHPMDVASGVNEVYLLPVPKVPGKAQGGEEAVVDLNGALAAAQPSGIEPETLTLLAMLATLHANIPSISQVHFLVDGQQRDTLAGHADLTRTYLASDTNPQPGPDGAGDSGGGR
jgi:hypothetical protein